MPSLSSRLLLALAVLLAVLVLGRVADQLDRQATRRRVVDAICRRTAQGSAQAFVVGLRELGRTVRTLGKRTVTGFLTPPQAASIFRELRQERSELLVLEVYEKSRGLLLQEPQVDPRDAGRSLPVPAFHDAGQFDLSDLYQARSAPRERVRLALPVADRAEPRSASGAGLGIQGLAAVVVDGAAFAGFLPVGRAQEGSAYLLLDGAGNPVASTSAEAAQKWLGSSDARAALRRGEGAFRTEQWTGWVTPIEGTRWRLLYGRPEQEILGIGLLDLRTDVPMLVLLAPIVALLIVLPLRLLAQPLARLSAGARL
ncbi:MAG: hypothetical protein FJX77_10310, partial [Armatimonadetes bacterium]|nr:hypothetical protein [Armatimonadota bacterium]